MELASPEQQQRDRDGDGDIKSIISTSQVHLRPNDPFDLEAYIAPYTDRRRILRLLFIARSCPELRVQAYKLALDAIKDTSLDYKLYLSIGDECKDVTIDRKWAQEAKKKQEAGLDKLDVELKNYQNNLIKESIRMGQRDLGDFQRKAGDLAAAIRSYTKSKDYCTTSHHVLDMCLCVIDTALDQSAYATVRSHVIKAESALNSITGSSKSAGDAGSGGTSRGVSLPGMLASAQPGKREEEARSKRYQMLGEKLQVASAIAEMGQSEYTKAAREFLNVSPPQASNSSSSSSRENAATSAAHYVPPADIGLYGVLCAMASFSRSQFKRLVVDNSNLRPYLEHTPFLKDVIQHYYNSRFLQALQILDENSTRMRLDIHLARHVNEILRKIKDKMVEQYFEPFRSVQIEKMASAFGWNAAALEKTLVRLIESGSMKARIDKQAQTIVSHEPDNRDVLYEKALKVADANAVSVQKLTYRMRLIQNELIVDARKDSAKALGGGDKSGQKPNKESKQDANTQQPLEEGVQGDESNLISAD